MAGAIRAWDVIRYADGAERAVRSAPSAICQPVRSGCRAGRLWWMRGAGNLGRAAAGEHVGTRVGMLSCFVPSLPAAS